MEGLSLAANIVAITSIAIQLADSVKKLCEFWKSIKDAPEEIHTIVADLELLSSVLAEITSEKQLHPDATTAAVLEICESKVKKLMTIVSDLEPGFASQKPSIRKWTAFKAVIKAEKLRRFQEAVERLKVTLILAQQNYLSRINHVRFETQQQDLQIIMRRVNSLNVQQASEPVDTSFETFSNVGYHITAIRREISRVANILPNLRCRSIFEMEMDRAMQQINKGLQSNDPKSFSETESIFSSYKEGTKSFPQCWSSRYQPLRNRTVRTRSNILQTFIGSLHVESKTIHVQPKYSSIRPAHDSQSEAQYEYQTASVIVYPAPWLVNRGFSYSPRVNAAGPPFWDLKLRVTHAVPDDNLVFEFCKQGNVPGLKCLFARKQASTKDVDSQGRTPIYRKSTLTDATNTLRLFEDCMDFSNAAGDGWQVLSTLCNQAVSAGGDEKSRIDLFLWDLRLSSSDMRNNFDETEFSRLLNFTFYEELQEAATILLSIGDNNINAVAAPNGYTVLHRRIAYAEVELYPYLAKWPDLHILGRDVSLSPQWESPTSLAMYSSWAFADWRCSLIDLKVDIEKFVRQELEAEASPLHDAGWKVKNLLALFHATVKPIFLPRDQEYSRCKDCSCDLDIRVQPSWIQRIERLKHDMDFDIDLGWQEIEQNRPDFSDDTFHKAEYDLYEATGEDSGMYESSTAECSIGDVPSMELVDETYTNNASSGGTVYGEFDVLCIACWDNYTNCGYKRF
ncbi:MAG: hypothetical protein Q9187_002672 [Circinaria calcarea]